jgi:formylglycine-generating enzyme required for sulfatase activity
MRRSHITIVLSLLILILPHGWSWSAESSSGAYHALIIGNNQYRELPRLETAANDAKALANVLRDKYGFMVELLLDADKHSILRAINRYRSDLGPDDNLLIYYAGHGWLDRETNTGFWQPVDAEADDDLNWIANEEITRRLKGMLARHVMVIADSCYSGTLLRGSIGSAPAGAARMAWLDRMAQKRSRTALVSGGLEPVEDRGRNGHSVFAHALLGALKENDGILDSYSLFQQISRPVVLEVDQTPNYSEIRKAGHEGGAFMFRRSRPGSADEALRSERRKVSRLPAVRQTDPDKAVKKAAPAKPAGQPRKRPVRRKRAGFKDCEYCPEMIVLPAGQYTMGTDSRWEGPPHPVTIQHPFAVSRFETTFGQWDLCAAAGHCTHQPDDKGWGRGNRPVINVSHKHTSQFLGWLSKVSGRRYRLPSEAEWEYAARSNTKTSRYWGTSIGSNNANCYQCGDGGGRTLPVGQYAPNGFGLYDMLGNVHEWVADCYAKSYEGAPADGSARMDGDCKERIARGGSWSTAYQAVTVSHRRDTLATRSDQHTGFRVVRSIPPDDLGEWRRLASAGDRLAQYHFATLLQRDGQQKDAMTWYRRAAEQGVPAAQFALYRLQGLTLEEARRWLGQAAEAGHARARLALAELLSADDPKSAYMWLELAIAVAAEDDVLRLAHARKTELGNTMKLTDIVEAQHRARAKAKATQ